ncbi:MAG TPA: tetratricopeptide repeat protein [Gemmatimonadaceae bacterium]|nr:tetratricopeptide repeat protein [Gemmatimonadaceae bacterium]
MIRLITLGAVDLHTADGRTLQSLLAQPKRLALLAYLAMATPRGFHRRDTLLGLFWAESETERARHSLNQAVYALRRILGESVVTSRGSEEIGVDPSLLWCDAVAFDGALARGALAEALELYRGDALQGFFLSDAVEFERWLDMERRRMRDRAAGAAWTLASQQEAVANGAGAAHWARCAAAFAPDDELALRRLVGLLDRVGDRAGALAAYESFAQRLADEYDGEPSEETRSLLEEMRSRERTALAPKLHSADSTLPGPAVGAPAAPPPLPAQPTPFIGREAELEQVASLLQKRECRLVTIVGAGGIGKTRLALQAAAAAEREFAHGVRFVPLVPVSSPDLLVSALGDGLDFRFGEGQEPGEQLLQHLAEKKLLLVLDNFDHLVVSAAFLTRVIERAPGVKLLVTSRQALNVRGEWLVPLQGLTVPRDTSVPIERYSAVQLFLQTATAAGERVDAGGPDGPPIVRICRMVEGVPLAIELAAAWVRVLTCEEICVEIERSHRFLAGSLRGVPERHRSLWAACESSWRRLPDEERDAFRRLAVFTGGFERDAAEAIAGAPLRVLAGLIEKSLLRRHASGRYQMLEVLRQYAEEQLGEDAEELRHLHCAFYCELLRRMGEALASGRHNDALTCIGKEIGNLRAAWRWAVAHRNAAALDASLEGLFVFYDTRGWHLEAEEAFGSAVRCLEASPAADEAHTGRTLARLLARQGVFSLRRGDDEQARQLLEQSLTIARRIGDRHETAFSLDRLGVVAYNLGQYDQARACQRESLAIRRELDDPHAVATSLNNLGSLAYALGDYAEARRLCEESLALQRQLGDGNGEVISLHNLAYIALVQGESVEARQQLEAALAVSRSLGSGLQIARSLYNLGNVANALGEFGAAKHYLEQAFAAAVETGASSLAMEVLIGMTAPLRQQSEYARAMELLAFVLGHPAAEKRHRDAAQRPFLELKAELSPDVFEASVERVRSLTLEELAGRLPVSPATA